MYLFIYMRIFTSVIFLLSSLGIYNCSQLYNSVIEDTIINLNSTNLITIKGEINSQSASDFIYELNKNDKKDYFVYLDTPGGSVEDGNKIISEVKKYNLSCIVDRAYSMGFAILQACKERLILPHGKLMQHQISYAVRNENEKVLSYIKYIRQLEKKLIDFQAKRIKMSPHLFKRKTMNEWWIYGDNAILTNTADKVVEVKCTEELTNKNYTIDTMFSKITYSKCPLISDPLSTEKKDSSDNLPFFV